MGHPHFPFSAVEATALREFLNRRTLPVFGAVDSHDVIMGTGSLLEARGQCFLITAAHIFENIPPNSLAVPDGRQNADVWSLGKTVVITAEAAGEFDLDAAVVWLKDKTTIQRLRTNWTFLRPADIAKPDTPARSYLISGFPEQYSSVAEEQTIGGQVLIATNRIDPPADAEKPVDPRVDLFFDMNERAVDLRTGEIGEPPRLQGVSGASVWCVVAQPPSDQVWSLESLIKVVAIQSAARHKRYIRAKNWRIISDMIMRLEL